MMTIVVINDRAFDLVISWIVISKPPTINITLTIDININIITTTTTTIINTPFIIDFL